MMNLSTSYVNFSIGAKMVRMVTYKKVTRNISLLKPLGNAFTFKHYSATAKLEYVNIIYQECISIKTFTQETK